MTVDGRVRKISERVREPDERCNLVGGSIFFSDVQSSTSFPGFMMLFGSIRCLIDRMSSIEEPCSIG